MIELYIVLIALHSILFGVICSSIGEEKGLAKQGFFAGFFLGVFGLAIILVSKGNRVECEYCKELINPTATKCPHCTSIFIKNESLVGITYDVLLYQMIYNLKNEKSFMINSNGKKLLVNINNSQVKLSEELNGNYDNYVISADITNLTGSSIVLNDIEVTKCRARELNTEYIPNYEKLTKSYDESVYNELMQLNELKGRFIKNEEKITGKIELKVDATYLPVVDITIKQV